MYGVCEVYGMTDGFVECLLFVLCGNYVWSD